jgi:hypothetical protein
LSYDGREARIGILKQWQKTVLVKVPVLVAAFEKVLNQPTQVYLEGITVEKLKELKYFQPQEEEVRKVEIDKNEDLQTWSVGDRVIHSQFGLGKVNHIFGEGKKLCLAIKFADSGQKIIDPKLTPLKRVD